MENLESLLIFAYQRWGPRVIDTADSAATPLERLYVQFLQINLITFFYLSVCSNGTTMSNCADRTPCLNGGICEIINNLALCRCADTYGGENCEVIIKIHLVKFFKNIANIIIL